MRKMTTTMRPVRNPAEGDFGSATGAAAVAASVVAAAVIDRITGVPLYINNLRYHYFKSPLAKWLATGNKPPDK